MKLLLCSTSVAVLLSTTGCLIPVREERVYVRQPVPYHHHHYHQPWQHKGYYYYHY
jgi:hypothetical protein